MQALTYNPDHPWVRQPCDTEFSWPVFLAYRDLPRPRSLVYLADVVNQALTKIRGWHKEHGWGLRVAAYDSMLDAKRTATVIDVLQEDAADRARRHIDLLRDLEAIVVEGAKEILSKVDRGEKLRLTPNELIKMAKTSIELQRLIYGETTANVHQTHDLGALTLEELEHLRALQLKAGGQ